MQKILISGWILSSIFLLLYSFTQVDLSLTLSQFSLWQVIQKSFQQIGYFNRPLSTGLFLIIVSLMFVLYGVTLYLIFKKRLNRKNLFGIIIGISAILFFSYNAFSYDLFNYIFDAKIFTHYFQNPYFYKALDFPEDPMLSFMHWTHRTYPYGPTWLLLTLPASFIGFGYFLLTLYLFKLLSVFGFIISAFLIEKIAKKLDENSLFIVAVFALNPLVIIESLVSSHNDIVMIAFALLSILAFFEKNIVKSFVWLLLSIGVKFATIFMLPAFFAKKIMKLDNIKFFFLLSGLMIIPLILATYRTAFQPWYFLFVLPFTAFISEKKYILIPTFVISLASLLQYAPFLYLGNWDPPVPTFLNLMMIVSVIVSLALIFASRLISNSKN